MTPRRPNGQAWKRGVWRPVPGFPGYEVSYSGRIRDTAVIGNPVILKYSLGPCGFHTVSLSRMGNKHFQLGKLTARAWIGPAPEGSTVRYLDGNLQNHNAANLAYGTRQQFYQDQADRAEREEAAGAPTHCDEGHPLSKRWFGGWGERVCVPCRRADQNARAAGPQDKPCEKCGVLMAGVHHNRKYCRPCLHQSGVITDKACGKCGTWMEHVHYTRRLCEDCGGGTRTPKGTLRDKVCTRCGDVMLQVSYQQRICDPCRRPKGTFNDRKCCDCGAVMKQVHYTRRLCDACKPRHLREYRDRRNVQTRKGLRVSHCVDCSTEISTTGSGPTPKRCSKHKAEAQRESERRHEEKRRMAKQEGNDLDRR